MKSESEEEGWVATAGALDPEAKSRPHAGGSGSCGLPILLKPGAPVHFTSDGSEICKVLSPLDVNALAQRGGDFNARGERAALASMDSKRPTGLPLPRASKLPRTGLPAPSQTTSRGPSPVKDVSSTVTRLQKRASANSLARPSQITSTSTLTGRSVTSGTNLPAGTRYGAKPSIPSSRAASQQRLPSIRTKLSANEDGENHDQLSSLDSFRSSSRQEFQDDPVAEDEDFGVSEPIQVRKTSRPSLSDRTIESLQSVPSTPKDRRRSSFFNPIESPMGPPPRPGSSLSRTGSSNGSRPGTSDGAFAKPFASPAIPMRKISSSARPAARTTSRTASISSTASSQRSVSSSLSSRLQEARVSAPQRAASPTKPTLVRPTAGKSIKPVASTIKPPGSAIKPPGSAVKQPGSAIKPPGSAIKPPGSSVKPAGSSIKPPVSRLGASGTPRSLKPPSIGAGATPAKPTRPLGTRPAAKPAARAPVQNAEERPVDTPVDIADSAPESKRVVSNSSAALRQQIAAAKAAARKPQPPKHDSPQGLSSSDDMSFEDEVHGDPFNQAPKDDKHILRNRINIARMDGKLNIAAMGLKAVPEEVLKMYDSASMTESNVNWAEVVDLTRFIAADNEFEEFDEAVFPDRTTDELAADDSAEGNQFGGLELLDLHGNILQALPMGLRQLERLTSLNVSHNKLDNTAFDVISQMRSLKELRLGHNNINGNLPATVCELPGLEVLDLQSNRLLAIPDALRELVALRVLNISGNQLTALPMEALQQIPLTELDASSNALIGSLFPIGGIDGHPTLQSLSVANNSIAALTFSETLSLPRLRSLNLTNNHMTVLPSVASWTELITLACGDNKITDFPHGFTSLRKLRNVNFTSNDIRLLNPEICKMDGLESIVLSANPLREKKFLTMSAADIKRDLKARLAPDPEDTDSECPGSPVTVIGAEEPPSIWTLKGNGLLDLAAQGLCDEDLVNILGTFLNNNDVRQVHLQYNKLTCIPPGLFLGANLRSIDLSGNSMGAYYLSDDMDLASLQELNVSKCGIRSFEPLVRFMHAPKLQVLNVNVNRLSGELPALRSTYPMLSTLFATDNKFTSISFDALQGMNTVNLSSNDIQQLPAEIGLLWEEGLRNFEVASNAFRVPNYRILDKGTEATLRWLRDRLPAGHASQGAEHDEFN